MPYETVDLGYVRGDTGPQGPTGPTSPTGPTDLTGANGPIVSNRTPCWEGRRHYPDANGPMYEPLVDYNAYSLEAYAQNWKLVE